MEIALTENVLFIKLDRKIDYRIQDIFNQNINSRSDHFNSILVNFSEVEEMTLPGVMNLILIIHGIVQRKKLDHKRIETLLGEYSDKQISLLSNFGFISSLILHGNLKVDYETSIFNQNRSKFWSNAIKISNSQQLNKVYWPIANIPKKGMTGFDQDIAKFFNDFVDVFNTIIEMNFFKLNVGDPDIYGRNFLKAINESVKNIWDHSESWGIASMQSDKQNKNTLCLFDYGVGFITSYIKRKGNYKRSAENDKKVIAWLFKEGNTSHEEANHGHGLSIILKFVEMTKGILLVSTDKYLIKYSINTGIKITAKEYFPGTQIMINF